MGGYGTVRIGMKHPEAFSVLYAMSSCCLMNDPQRLLPGAGANQPPTGVLAKALSAQAAAWAPNPMNPPQFFDLPTKDGEIQPLIAAKWVTNSPLVMVDQYVPSLKRYQRNRHGRRYKGSFSDHEHATGPGPHTSGSRSQVRDL